MAEYLEANTLFTLYGDAKDSKQRMNWTTNYSNYDPKKLLGDAQANLNIINQMSGDLSDIYSAELSSLGLSSDKFFFAGFPPVKTKQKVDFFNDLISIPSTIIFFESPKRIIKTLKELGNVFGSSHNIAICRELTKNFEENKRGSISSIINSLTSENKLKGEFTVIVDKKKIDKPDLNFIKSDLNNLLKSKTLKDSVLIISQKYSLSRREVYNLGLEILKS